MLWRRRNEGFEWHKYVRTTIKLRRHDRRRRIAHAQEAVVGGLKEAGQAAVESFKDAGQVAVEGLKDAGRASVAAGSSGIAAAGRLGWIGMRFGFAGLRRLGDEVPRAAAVAASAILVPAWRWTRFRLMPVAAIIDRSGYAQVLLLLGAILLAIGVLHASAAALDSKAMAVIGLALGLLAAGTLPFSVGGRSWPGTALWWHVLSWIDRRLPWLDTLPRPPFRVIGGGLVLAALLGIGWLIAARPSIMSLSGQPGSGADALKGRATVLSGDTLRLAGRTIRLSGVDAPELDQQCGGEGRGRSWRCGAASQAALQTLVRGRMVHCTAARGDASGHPVATCYLGEKDLAAELVRRGHAFAESGLFSTYAGLESTARNAKLGLWRSAVERPSDYRARRWEAAKRSAPHGCPIKGHVTSEGRVYVLPWSPDYSRLRVREQRGERWFCSEQEARAAGWRPVDQS